MKRNGKQKKQKQILETAKNPPVRDIVLHTPEEAEVAYSTACEAFDSLVPGLRGEAFIQLVGNVLRLPAWFRAPLLNF